MKKIVILLTLVAFGFGVGSCEIANLSASNEASLSSFVSDLLTTTDSVKTGRKHNHIAVDIATLSAPIKTYISTNYVGYTINKAHTHGNNTDIDVLISKDTLSKIVVFAADGTFIKEKLKGSKGHFPKTEVAIADIPTAVSTYITANYTGATINKAFKDVNNGLHVIVSLADGTHKAVVFDATNAFVEEKTGKGKKGGKGRG